MLGYGGALTFHSCCCLGAKLVLKSCPTLCHPMDCSPQGSTVHGIFQARILEWVAISFSRGSPQPRNRTCVPCIDRQIFYHWATRGAPDFLLDFTNISLSESGSMKKEEGAFFSPLPHNVAPADAALILFFTPRISPIMSS